MLIALFIGWILLKNPLEFKFLNSLFIELKGFTFEKSILKNFKTYKDAKHIFSGKTELGDEGFTPKTQEQKDKEELEDEYEMLTGNKYKED